MEFTFHTSTCAEIIVNHVAIYMYVGEANFLEHQTFRGTTFFLV